MEDLLASQATEAVGFAGDGSGELSVTERKAAEIAGFSGLVHITREDRETGQKR